MSDRQDERGGDDPNSDLSARIEAARAAIEDKHDPGAGSKYSALSLAWRMVIELVVGCLIGGAIGWGLDSLTGWSPAFMIVFGLLGFAAGAKTAIGTAQDVGKRVGGGGQNGGAGES